MKIVVSNGIALAAHADAQDVAGLYPGCIVLTVPDSTTVEAGDPWEVDLAAARAAKIAEAAAACDAVLGPLGVEYGRWETATWDQQYAEAVALMADPSATVPLLTALAAARGMAVADQAQRILRNRESWSVLSGAVVGQRLAVVDRINAAATVTDVLAVEVVIGLPR